MENDIVGLQKEDAQGNFTEDLTNGIFPKGIDGSGLVGVYGGSYIASSDPTVDEDGSGSSAQFPGRIFEVGQRWFNQAKKRHFICIENTSGAARWVQAGLDGSYNDFIVEGGSSIIVTPGDIVKIDDTPDTPANSIDRALSTDDTILGVAIEGVSDPESDVDIRVISNGIAQVSLRTGLDSGDLLKGQRLFVSDIQDGKATDVDTGKPIGFVVNGGTNTIFVGVAAGGGSGPGISDLQTIAQTSQNITQNYTFDSGYNGLSAGPVTIDVGVTVTVPVGATWKVL